MNSGLFSRLAWGFGIAFVLLHVGTGLYHVHDALVRQAADFTLAQLDRVRLIGELTAAEPELLARLSSSSFRIRSVAQQPAKPTKAWRHQAEISALVDPQLAALGFVPSSLNYWFVFGRDGPHLIVAMRLAAKGANPPESSTNWMLARVRAEPARWQRHVLGWAWTTVFALLILGVVLWATRRYTRFLPQLAIAAERIGHFGGAEPLPLTGPKEVRKVGAAFNQMQARLQAHERERSTMLGAFSHDIRTLVTRIRLRLDRFDDAPEVAKMTLDLGGITQIVDEALAYSRDESSDEPKTPIDLASMLQTLVDDTAGAKLALPSGDQQPVTLVAQHHGLRRAVLNLMNNAVLYGHQATVSWDVLDGVATIRVTDAGEGIPPAERQRVVQPYVRLEGSRNRQTGGSGLGLAIANNVARRHGGSLSFATIDAGFQARLAIPLLPT